MDNEEKVKLGIYTTGAKESSNDIDSVTDSLDKLDKKHKKMSKDLEKSDLFKKGILAGAIKQSAQKIVEFAKKSADYVETLNVLDVAFNNNTSSIKQFTNAISETLNLDDATLIRSASRFKTLANSMSIAEEAGTNFSKMLTQMTLDVSSLYNMDFQKAEQALQYAVMGRGTTLKQKTGVSVLESTVQTTLETLGVDAYVEDMNDTEKAIARVISMSYQLRNSQGDLARTIEAPANQFRVLGEQVSLAGRNIGNVFLPAISAILPYLNAILIVINKILSGLASLFGFSESAWDFFGDTDAVVDSFDEIGASIGGVGDAASSTTKKLQGLRAFDKLNNLTTPRSGSGGSAGGGSGSTGINPNLLKAFSDIFANYNSNLDGIKTKASQIAEDILRWLNFSYEIDPLTGKIQLKYKGLKGTLKNMWESFKKMSIYGKILTGLGLGTGAKKLYDIIVKLVKVIGNTSIGKFFSQNILLPFKNLIEYIRVYKSISGSLSGGLLGGTQRWLEQLSVMQRLTIGIGGLIASYGLLNSAMKDIYEQGELTTSSILKMSGSILSAAASGAVLGSAFGPVGTIIGAVAGALLSLGVSLVKMPTDVDIATESIKKQNQELQNYLDSLNESDAALEKDLTLKLSSTGIHKQMVDELKQITDENGNVKKGYEDQAKFIIGELQEAYGIEIDMSDGRIEKYQEQIKKIYELIKAKEAEIILEANKTKYVAALEEESHLYNELKEQHNNVAEAQQNVVKAKEAYERAEKRANVVSLIGIAGDLASKAALEKKKKAIENAEEALSDAMELEDAATEAYKQNQLTQINYTDLKTAVITGDTDKINEAIENHKNTFVKNGEIIKITDDENTERQIFNAALRVATLKETNKEQYDDYVKTLQDETNATKGMGDEQATAWYGLAQGNKEAFMKEFKKLPADIQQNVVDKMQEKGFNISDEMQKGLNKINPTLKINSSFNSTGVTNDIKNWLRKNANLFGAAAISIPTPQFAQGGLPSVGQMFIANERGPELVGQIGGQSFVANQNQMLDIIDKKLSNAGGLQNATFIVQVGNEEVARTVIRDLQSMAKSDGKPITIGG